MINISELIEDSINKIKESKRPTEFPEAFEVFTNETIENHITANLSITPLLSLAILQSREAVNSINTLLLLFFEIGRARGRQEIINGDLENL